MNITQFVEQNLGEHKQKGNEIVVKVCPICKAEEKDNQYKFYINTNTGLYNCKRGSCQAKGHINQLTKIYKTENVVEYDKPINQDKRQAFMKEARELKTEILSEKTLKWANDRAITENTLKYIGCRTEKGTHNLIIPIYDKTGSLCNFKKRLIKISEDGIKSLNSSNGEGRLIGQQLCVDETKPLLIVEGEMDWISIIETDKTINVVSVPNGTNDMRWIELDAEFINRFEDIIIWTDNDKAGDNLLNDLKKRLIDKNVKYIKSVEKDANDTLVKYGKEKVLEEIANAKEIEIQGLIDVSTIERKDIFATHSISSGISGIDKVLDGFRMGEVTVWSGRSQSGKSTMLGQSVINAAANEEKIFFYTGELTKHHFQEWLYLQANGKEELEKIKRRFSDKYEMRVSDINHAKISKWLKGKIYLFDKSDIVQESELFQMMKIAYKKFGCRTFVIDNLMMISFGETEADFNRKQSHFVKQLKAFAKNQMVHIHLVAHSKKTQNSFVEKDDVAGTSDITNLCDNIISVNRVFDRAPISTVVKINKNRMYGENTEIELAFDSWTKRFYSFDKPIERDLEYNWRFITVDKKDDLDW